MKPTKADKKKFEESMPIVEKFLAGEGSYKKALKALKTIDDLILRISKRKM